MKIIISLLLGLLLFGCVQPEDIGNEQHIKKKSSLQIMVDRFNRKRPAKEALSKADNQYLTQKTFLSDTLIQIALRYYKNDEISPELARTYYYLGLYYEDKKLFQKALLAYTYAGDALPCEDDSFLRDKLDQKQFQLYALLGKNKTEEWQWKYRYENIRNKNIRLQKQLNIWRFFCVGSVFLLLFILGLARHRTNRRRRELFESQLFIERLQRAEEELKEKLLRELDEKDNKLKEFFRLRVEMIKEFVELSRKYGNNLEKLKDKFSRMVSTDSFSPADWILLKEGVNIMGNGIIDHLQKTYPELTEENLRYCALICAGFETDELAILWDINNDSIYKRRTRLRQKLGLAKTQDIKKFFDSLITELRKKRC